MSTVAGCTVRFYRDHEPAHLHAVMPDGDEAQVRITDATVLRGSLLPAARRALLDWAASRRDALAWLRCRQRLDPGRIE